MVKGNGVRFSLEKARTKVRPVQRVANHPANINSPDSTDAFSLAFYPSEIKGTWKTGTGKPGQARYFLFFPEVLFRVQVISRTLGEGGFRPRAFYVDGLAGWGLDSDGYALPAPA